MLRKLENLQGVSVLSKEAQKKVTGQGGCGVFVGGSWMPVADTNGDGRTIDNVPPGSRWCCDSCPWNQYSSGSGGSQLKALVN